MSNLDHRNITKKHFCPGCDHFHQVVNAGMPARSGICVLYPPTPFVVGMAQPAIAPAADPSSLAPIPIIRGYYPPVGAGDTCAQWTPRAEGEA